MRFLIDECLSIDLISIASQAGHDAQHVARVGKAGWKDWNVARHAAEGDFVVVTNNASDFRRLYAQPLHAGLIITARSRRQPIEQPRSCKTSGSAGRTTSPTRPAWCTRRFSFPMVGRLVC
jgi:hypothetical protein